MKTYHISLMCALLLPACAGSRRIEITTVALPPSQAQNLTTAEQILAAAAKKGVIQHKWTSPIASDGTFRMDRQKPVSYVTEYSATGKPVVYDHRLVGATFHGRVDSQKPNLREIQLELAQCDHTGTNTYGPGIEQPVFVSRTISTSWVGEAHQWMVFSIPANSSKPSEYYVLARAD